MPICVVKNCHYTRDDIIGEKGMITFHSFPHDAELRRKWIEFTSLEKWVPKYNSVMCSQHFEVSCFKDAMTLSSNAVPTMKRIKTGKCEVPGCSTTLSGETRHFLRFPREETDYIKWMENIMNYKGVDEETIKKITPDSRICLAHFDNTCITVLNDRKFLRPGSLPTLHLAGQPLHLNNFEMEKILVQPETEETSNVDLLVAKEQLDIGKKEQKQSIRILPDELLSPKKSASSNNGCNEANIKYITKIVKRKKISSLNGKNKKIILVKLSDLNENFNKKNLYVLPEQKLNNCELDNAITPEAIWIPAENLQKNKEYIELIKVGDLIDEIESQNESIESKDLFNLLSQIDQKINQSQKELLIKKENIIEKITLNDTKPMLPDKLQENLKPNILKKKHGKGTESDRDVEKLEKFILIEKNIAECVTKGSFLTEICPGQIYIMKIDKKIAIITRLLVDKYFRHLPIKNLTISDCILYDKVRKLSTKRNRGNKPEIVKDEEIRDIYEIIDLIHKKPCNLCCAYINKFKNLSIYTNIMECFRSYCSSCMNTDRRTTLRKIYNYFIHHLQQVTGKIKIPNKVITIIKIFSQKHRLGLTEADPGIGSDITFFDFITNAVNGTLQKGDNPCVICPKIIIELQADYIKTDLIEPLEFICNQTNIYTTDVKLNKMYIYLTEEIEKLRNIYLGIYKDLVRKIIKCHELALVDQEKIGDKQNNQANCDLILLKTEKLKKYKSEKEQRILTDLISSLNDRTTFIEPKRPSILKKSTKTITATTPKITTKNIESATAVKVEQQTNIMPVLIPLHPKTIHIDANILNDLKKTENIQELSVITLPQLKDIMEANKNFVLRTVDGNLVLTKQLEESTNQLKEPIKQLKEPIKQLEQPIKQLNEPIKETKKIEVNQSRRKQKLETLTEKPETIEIQLENTKETKSVTSIEPELSSVGKTVKTNQSSTDKVKTTQEPSRKTLRCEIKHNFGRLKNLLRHKKRFKFTRIKSKNNRNCKSINCIKSKCVMCRPKKTIRKSIKTDICRNKKIYRYSDDEMPISRKTRRVSVRYIKDKQFIKTDESSYVKTRRKISYDPLLLNIKDYKKIYDDKISNMIPQVVLPDIFKGRCPKNNCRITVTSRKVFKNNKTIDLTNDNELKIKQKDFKYVKNTTDREKEEQMKKFKSILEETDSLTKTQEKLLNSLESLPSNLVNDTLANIQKLLSEKQITKIQKVESSQNITEICDLTVNDKNSDENLVEEVDTIILNSIEGKSCTDNLKNIHLSSQNVDSPLSMASGNSCSQIVDVSHFEIDIATDDSNELTNVISKQLPTDENDKDVQNTKRSDKSINSLKSIKKINKNSKKFIKNDCLVRQNENLLLRNRFLQNKIIKLQKLLKNKV